MSDESSTPESARRDQAGRFQPGASGNPRGRTPGAKHEALKLLDAIGEEGAERVLRKVLEMAEAGDMKAAELLLRRLWPERRGRPVRFTLPPVTTAAGAVAALGAVAAAVAEGSITPEEGLASAGVLEAVRRSAEIAELDARLKELESREGRTHRVVSAMLDEQ